MEKPAIRSKIITWGGYLALTLLLGLALSVFIVRAGQWQQGLLLYALCCAGSAALLAVFLITMAVPRFSTVRRHLLLPTLAALPGGILFLILLLTRGDYPAIHDVTTDVVSPPVFTRAVQIRDQSANSLVLNEQTLAAQQAAYPDLKPTHSTLNFDQAFAHAMEVAEQLGWEITHSDPEAGTIEAVATTTIMAFKDDIVIRIQRSGSGTLIDLRSASRVGQSDLGANASRIRTFLGRYKS